MELVRLIAIISYNDVGKQTRVQIEQTDFQLSQIWGLSYIENFLIGDSQLLNLLALVRQNLPRPEPFVRKIGKF